MYVLSLLLAALFLALPGYAQETAALLPKGYFRARVASVFTQTVDSSYNNDGQLVSLGNSLDRSVTIQDLALQQPKLIQLRNALDAVQPGLGDQAIGSNLYSNITVQNQVFVPALEYGLTKDINVGARVYIVKSIVQNQFHADTVNNGAALANAIGQLSPEVRAATNTLGSTNLDTAFYENAIFTSKGYDAPKNFEKTELGDIETGAKFNLHKDDIFVTSTLLGIRVPTGSSPSLTDVADKGSGKGAWGVAGDLYQNINPAPFLTLSAYGRYTYNLPDTRKRAVPKDDNDLLPSLLPQDGQVQDVTRKMGNQIETELSSTFNIMQKTWQTWAAYQTKSKGKDTFSGPGNLDYAVLSNNTDTFLSAAEFGLGYSTIPAFRKHKFSVPMEIQLMYDTPLAGRNVPLAAYTRVDLRVYF